MTTDQKQGLKEKIEKKLNQLKASAEHLNVQLHLGAAEAKDEFEEQKKNLAKLVDTAQEKLGNVIDAGEEKAKNLKTTIDELRVQAALGRAETEDVLEDQAKKINKGLNQLKKGLANTADKAEHKAESFADETKHQIEDMHTRFDLLRLRTHLGKKEAEKAWDEKKKELSEKLHEFNQKLEKGKDVAEDKWEHFADEMSEAWDHLKKAFKA